MKSIKTFVLLALLSLWQAALAQKVKIDTKAVEIIGENAAAAVAVEKLRTVQIDSIKTRKQKVNEALLQINVLKESLRLAKKDTEYFRLESGYYKHIIEDAAAILELIPKFVSTATTVSPQASVKAIKVGTEISEQVAGIVSTYKKVCVNEVEIHADTISSNGSNDNIIADPIDDGPGSGSHKPIIGDDDIVTIASYSGANGGPRHAAVKDPKEPGILYNIRLSDGFNWMDRMDRLELAIDLSSRLASIRYKMEMFIRTARLYKPSDIIRMVDPYSWAFATAAGTMIDDIVYKINNFSLSNP